VGDPTSDVPELRTERLVLRAWREEDRVPFAAMNADPVVMEHYPSTMDRTESDAFVDRILLRWAQGRPSLWAVEVPGEAAFIEMWESMGGQERFDRRRRWWAEARTEFVGALR